MGLLYLYLYQICICRGVPCLMKFSFINCTHTSVYNEGHSLRLAHHTNRNLPIRNLQNKLSALELFKLRKQKGKCKRSFISHTYVCYFSCLLTPWSRLLLEKLTGFQLVKKFPVFYGTRRFITAFTNARHLSLSSASSIQSIHPHPTS